MLFAPDWDQVPLGIMPFSPREDRLERYGCGWKQLYPRRWGRYDFLMLWLEEKSTQIYINRHVAVTVRHAMINDFGAILECTGYAPLIPWVKLGLGKGMVT